MLASGFAFFQECQQYRRGQVENPDLYKYLTLQLPSPSGLGENPVYVELLAWVEEKNLLTKR